MKFIVQYVIILVAFCLCFIVLTAMTVISFSQKSLRQRYPFLLLTFVARCGISLSGITRAGVYIALLRTSDLGCRIAMFKCIHHGHGVLGFFSFLYQEEMSLLLALQCLLVTLVPGGCSRWLKPLFSWFSGLVISLILLTTFSVGICYRVLYSSFSYVYNHCRLQQYTHLLPIRLLMYFQLSSQAMTVILCIITLLLIVKRKQILCCGKAPFQYRKTAHLCCSTEMRITVWNLVGCLLHLLYYGLVRHKLALPQETSGLRGLLQQNEVLENIVAQDWCRVIEMLITVFWMLMTPIYSVVDIFFRGKVDNIVDLGHVLAIEEVVSNQRSTVD